MSAADAGRVLHAFAEFLRRYGFWLAILVGQAVMLARRRKQSRAIRDSPLLADWSDRQSSALETRIEGVWQGRKATLRDCKSSDRDLLAMEATLETPTGGRFLVERGGTNVLRRPLHLGAPPIVEPMNPADGVFRVRSSDRTLTDRLLGDGKARGALSDALDGPIDEVSLRQGLFIVRRHFPLDERERALGQSLAVLKEMARVLG
jgi:hypothetical protein